MNSFGTWTKVDLTDLINAPFHNSNNNDPKAINFWNYLSTQVERGFPSMTIVETFLKKAKGVSDPHTNKKLMNVMWPPTDEDTSIPITKRFLEGTLEGMKIWTYDGEIATVIIRLVQGRYHLVDPRDLLKFGESDIKILSAFQINAEPLYEPAIKEYTSMAGSIIQIGLWAGAYKKANDDILEHKL